MINKLILIIFLILLSSNISLAQNKIGEFKKDTSFFSNWTLASQKSIQLLIDSCNCDSTYKNKLIATYNFFKKQSLLYRAVAIDSLLRHSKQPIFIDLYVKSFIIIEYFETASFMDNYELNISKSLNNEYVQYKYCTYSSNYIEINYFKHNITLQTLNNIKKISVSNHDNIKGMVTIIEKGKFECIPLLFLSEKEKQKISIK